MIETIEDVLKLPQVLFEDRRKLPKTRGIYFVLEQRRNLIYIGSAIGINGFRGRWVDSHHKKKHLIAMSEVTIAYLEIADEKETISMEELCIFKFRPCLNQIPERLEWKYGTPKISSIADIDFSELTEAMTEAAVDETA